MSGLFLIGYICAVLFMMTQSYKYLSKLYIEDKRRREDVAKGYDLHYTPFFTFGDVVGAIFITFVPIVNVVATSVFLVGRIFDVITPYLKKALDYPVLGQFKKNS